jgi:TonB family protein
MRPTFLESGRNFYQSAECVFLSALAHFAFVWFAVGLTSGGRQMPADEREARVFFLLPPDRVDVRDLQNGKLLANLEAGWARGELAYGARGKRNRSGARSQLPAGPSSPYIPDTAFSVLEVDEMVRFESSAAPIYPKDLMATGTEGLVQATYVVDTVGTVDTSTVRVMYSDDPRFTESVRAALGQMKFRPAKRAGKTVRQLVEQKFRFKIVPASQLADQLS